MSDPREHVVERLEHQSRSCESIGSPLYARLLAAAAADAEAGGPVWRIVEPYAGDPDGTALALRFMAAVHRLALRGAAPELAAFYPSAGGRVANGAEAAFLATAGEHETVLRADTAAPLQTNDAGRAAALVGGFLTVAARYGLPLRALEIGASAGLNLRWDHFLYEARGATWGDPESPVRLCDFNTEKLPPFEVDATVHERRGCDPRPIDATTGEGATLLLSFVWPDQIPRIRLLRGAIEVARRVPATVDAAPAAQWLRKRAAPEAGLATVVFHSIVVQYLEDEEQKAVAETIERSGAQATPDAPFAYLRMEPDYDGGSTVVEVRLKTWPGGEDVLLAHSGFHGTGIRWLAR